MHHNCFYKILLLFAVINWLVVVDLEAVLKSQTYSTVLTVELRFFSFSFFPCLAAKCKSHCGLGLFLRGGGVILSTKCLAVTLSGVGV
jgi:hypothetical protein